MALSDERSRAPALKRLIQKATRVVGLHVGRYPPVDSLAYHLKTVLRELDINCVLDVGAHEGEFAAVAARSRLQRADPVVRAGARVVRTS